MDNEKGGPMGEEFDDIEHSFENLDEQTIQKMGEAATRAVDLDRLSEEVEKKVTKDGDPNTGYEMFMDGRDGKMSEEKEQREGGQ